MAMFVMVAVPTFTRSTLEDIDDPAVSSLAHLGGREKRRVQESVGQKRRKRRHRCWCEVVSPDRMDVTTHYPHKENACDTHHPPPLGHEPRFGGLAWLERAAVLLYPLKGPEKCALVPAVVVDRVWVFDGVAVLVVNPVGPGPPVWVSLETARRVQSEHKVEGSRRGAERLMSKVTMVDEEDAILMNCVPHQECGKVALLMRSVHDKQNPPDHRTGE